ncbi:proline-rich basic protein 1 isoform X2 [Amblyraja radiata]|uniref:proline-rich basic protein 1 isoform X2 n=1 Tax=Amblyraja radiata TaxID=386614 RepID=UPI0014035716|nr:proline-rich basic protein 1 isoform X2 [Amblyraja radiata]
MNNLDQKILFGKNPKENNNKNEPGANFVSEIWFKSLSNNSNADSNCISDNTFRSIETGNQVLAEDHGQLKANTSPSGILADPDSINNDQLFEPGIITSTVKTSFDSPLFLKGDDNHCDSSGSYHTAAGSDIGENLSDCSGPYEDFEELSPDQDESQEISQRFGASQKEQSVDWLNSSEIETSLNDCSPPPQFSCREEQEQIFVSKHKMELLELNAGGELNGDIKPFQLHSRNVPDVKSHYKMDVGLAVKTADENNSFGYEITSSPQEEKNACSSDVVSNDSLLTTHSNSSAEGEVNKSSECDLTGLGTNLQNCKGNGDQQVHLSITAQNSKTAERGNGVQLSRKQEAEVSMHASPGCYLHLGLNEIEEMPQKDEFEDSAKNNSSANGKRRCAESMSESSSFASELDETDYEVRKLTALAFRSLSCPNDNYLHIYNSGGFIDFSPALSEECHNTKSVSVCSEPDFVGTAGETEEWGLDPSYAAYALYTGAEESNMFLDDPYDRMQFECIDVAVESPEKGKDARASRTVPKRQIELRRPQRSEFKVFTSSSAINSYAYVGLGDETGNEEERLEIIERTPYIENAISTNIKNKNRIHKQPQRAISIDGPTPRNKFASSLLSNVISKKMLYEQNLKAEQKFNRFARFPITRNVRKKDRALSPIVSQQIDHESSVSKLECNNSQNVAQNNLRKNGCELTGDNAEENEGLGQKCCYSSLRCAGGQTIGGQNNISPDCCTTNVLENYSETHMDSQCEASAERTPGKSREKSCSMFNNPSINVSGEEKNLTSSCTSVGKYKNGSWQNTEENAESDNSIQYELPSYEDKTSDIQLSKSSHQINASRNILALKSSKMLHNSPKPNVQRTITCCVPKTHSLTPESNTSDLDPNNQTLPVSPKANCGMEKTNISHCNIEDNISIKNKTKCPTYVRDVKNLGQNNNCGLTFCATKGKCDVPDEVCNPSIIKQSLPEPLNKVSIVDSISSPKCIQRQSIGRKVAKDDNSYVTVGRKGLISTESSETSRLFSSDFKLPIPCKKQENNGTSAKRICNQDYFTKDNENNVAEPLNSFPNIVASERKMHVKIISNIKESKSPPMKVQFEEETLKAGSDKFMLNNRITDLVTGESNQQNQFLEGLENLNAHSSSTIDDTNYALTEKQTDREIENELEGKEMLTNPNSNKEDIQMELYKDEPREIPERIQNHEDEKATCTKIEMQNHPLGAICYNIEQLDLSIGKSSPQGDNQDKLKSHNGLFCNFAGSNKSIGMSLWKDDTNNNRLSSNDKETQTPSRKSKHKKELKFKLENQKTMENSTIDNNGFEQLCETSKLKRGIQVNLKEQSELIENSAPNKDASKLLLNYVEDQIALDGDNLNKLASESKDDKNVSDMQSGLPNEANFLFKSSSNPKEIRLSPIKHNLDEGIDDGIESQNMLNRKADIKLQAIKTKNNDLVTEFIAPQNTDKVEMLPRAESARLTVVNELQLNKDNNKMLMVSEEEKQNPSKECSESGNIKTVDELLSTLKVQIPNEIGVPVITISDNVIPVESSNCSKTIKISANTSFPETEGQDVHNKLEISAAIQNAEVNKLLAPQTPSCFTDLNVKSINSNHPVVKSSNSATHDQEQQPSFELKMLAMNKAVTQDPSLTSAPINYLSIPNEEHKPRASPKKQVPAPPHSLIHIASTSPRQQNWETLNPHKQEQQALPHQCLGEMFSFDTSLQHPFYASSQVPNQAESHLLHFTPTSQTPDHVDKCYRVPQSPHLMDSLRLPCFQYPEAHKKVLIDPETGKHYFVEAPMQSPRKMLLDPETGCYVEVIIPQQTYGGYYQTSFSPHVLYPNVLRPSFIPTMQYSDLISTPLVAYPGPHPGSSEVQNQSSPNSTTVSVTEMPDHKKDMPKNHFAETNYMESTYSTPMNVPVNPNQIHTAAQVISIHSKSRAEVKDNSRV